MKAIDVTIITHEHADHIHSESILELQKNNPKVQIVTNSSVGKILTELGLPYQILEGNQSGTVKDILIEACDGKHAEIFEEYGQVQNTGYCISEKFFYPGDAYTEPKKDIEILALPIAGPCCKSADAIAYAIRVNPKKVFPVHDWLLNSDGIALTYGLFETQLKNKNIEFVRLGNNETMEF